MHIHLTRWLALASLSMLVLGACKARPRLDPRQPYPVERASFTVPLDEDGLATDGEITFPDVGEGPHPTVVLLHGSGPQDRNATLEGPVGTTYLFRDLADVLSAKGFAVVRYDKRHVSGPGDVDLPKFFGDQSTFTFRDDAARVLDQVASHPRVDADRIFVYGWSEGTVVAAALATERPLAGVILQGPVGRPYKELFRGWFDLAVPYLKRFTRDDNLDGAELGLALRSAASQPALMPSRMLAVSYTRNSEVAKPSPLIDVDRNGRISIENELIPKIDDLVDLAFGPIGSFVSYAEGNTLPPVPDQAAGLAEREVPVLVLQGMEDAHTPPDNADRIESALEEAGHPDVQIVRLDGLGHTLGRANDPVDDLGRPMAPEAVDALVDWLVKRAR
jgi:pimeloyl-ACP methyl ester carboxylesterase